jgi:hypothetical protein
MKRSTKWIATGAVALAALGAGTGIAVASGGGDDDASSTPVSGAALEHASSVALAETGGGKVTGSEAGDEQGAYEIEVTLDDGTQVDVHLDKDFNVINTEHEGREDAGENAGKDK